MARFPDYYKVLNIEKSATQDEIRAAYKKEALRTHPDRTANASAAEKQKATEKFQAVGRLTTCSLTLPGGENTTQETEPTIPGRPEPQQPRLKRRTPTISLLTFSRSYYGRKLNAMRLGGVIWVPFVGNAGIGFMIGSFPGVMIGAAAGNRLGAVRDAKGKNVAAVFNDLGENQKAEILRALAFLVLASTTA